MADGGTLPTELCLGIFRPFLEDDPNIVPLIVVEFDFFALGMLWVGSAEYRFTINPYSNVVIDPGIKNEFFRDRRLDFSSPFNHEVVWFHTGIGGVVFPLEIDRRIEPDERGG